MKHLKIFSFIVASIFLFLGACSKKENTTDFGSNEEKVENLNESGLPIVNEEITLDFFARKYPASNEDWNDILVFNEYEKMTNIKINWQMVPEDSVVEKRNLAFGGGNLPDAFHTTSISDADLVKYGNQELLLPLNDLIDDYAPNFKQILEEYPEIVDSITMPDGNIYAFPMLSDPEFLSVRIGAKPFINTEWLEELGLDMPQTTDDYYEYLKAVKNESPSNGQIDEIPFGGPSIYNLYASLLGSFGLSNKGSAVQFIDLEPGSEEYRFYPISNEYKELLEYLNKLYSEELIEKNIFSIEHDQYLANMTEGKYGSLVWYSPIHTMSEEIASKYEGMPALEGPHGDKMWTQISDAVMNPGAFAITSANENVAETVRWIDYFYGEEGIQFYFMGIESETYEINDEGEPELKDHILNNKDGLTVSEALGEYLPGTGGGQPSMILEKYFNGAENKPDALEAASRLEPDIVENPWPALRHTTEENNQLSGFGADIEKYVEEMRDKFISGNESFSNWDDYVKEVERMGLNDYMEIKTEAIERQVN